MVSKLFLKGISYIEVVISIFIVSIILGMGVYGVSILNITQKQQQLSNMVLADLRNIQGQSMTSGRDSVVYFSQNSYQIYLASQMILEKQLEPPFSFVPVRLGFKSNGNTKYAGTLILQRNRKNTKKITLAPGPGILRLSNI